MKEVKNLWPEVAVVSSHQITREWREYERTSTTVLSAYVQPAAEKYLRQLAAGLSEKGFKGSPYIMQSNCGVDSLEAVSRVPITMVESGPASGFWGAAELGKLINEPNVIALDIGGTTAKCSLIENGKVIEKGGVNISKVFGELMILLLSNLKGVILRLMLMSLISLRIKGK